MLAECSVINPLTNSDSASARSNGALFVSAMDAITKIINKGNSKNINHIFFCISIITVKFKLALFSIISNKAELNISS